MLRWYLGCEVVEVYAEVDNLFYPGEVDVDTAGIVLVTFENGVFASIDCSWSRPTTYPRFGHYRMEVIGEGGFVVADPLAQYHTVYSKKTLPHPVWVGWGADRDQAMVDEFAQHPEAPVDHLAGWLRGAAGRAGVLRISRQRAASPAGAYTVCSAIWW
jgi:predicted dehydrogenase